MTPCSGRSFASPWRLNTVGRDARRLPFRRLVIVRAAFVEFAAFSRAFVGGASPAHQDITSRFAESAAVAVADVFALLDHPRHCALPPTRPLGSNDASSEENDTHNEHTTTMTRAFMRRSHAAGASASTESPLRSPLRPISEPPRRHLFGGAVDLTDLALGHARIMRRTAAGTFDVLDEFAQLFGRPKTIYWVVYRTH